MPRLPNSKLNGVTFKDIFTTAVVIYVLFKLFEWAGLV